MTQDLQTSAPQLLALFETTKAERQSFIQNVIQQVRDGNADVLKVHMQAKCSQDLMKDLLDDREYKDLLLEQAQKHGKSFEMHNSKFEVSELGTKYDYSVCNDSVYNELEKEKAALDFKIKERQKLLQTIPETGIVEPSTGEMIYRANKSSTTGVKVSLK